MKDAYDKIVEIIGKIAESKFKESYLTRLIVGKVVTTSPLSIEIDADSTKRTITSNFLLLSSTCKKKEVDNTHYHIYQDHDKNDGEGATEGDPQVDAHTSNEIPNDYTYKGHTITKPPKIILWDDLQVGETVLLLRVNNGQKYWVLDRTGE